MIPFRSSRKRKWDILIVILAIQNSIVNPLEIGFNPAFTQHIAYTAVQSVVDFIFLVDIFVCCLTTFINKQGVEEYNSFKTAGKYMVSVQFAADSLALMGSEFVVRIFPQFKILGLAKVTRILKVGFLINTSNMSLSYKAPLVILKLFVYLFLMIHTMGCSFWKLC